jgi:hypothetical protein
MIAEVNCPECDSERVIILVHSLRALCSECMVQWAPSDEHPDVLALADYAASVREIRTEGGESPAQ